MRRGRKGREEEKRGGNLRDPIVLVSLSLQENLVRAIFGPGGPKITTKSPFLVGNNYLLILLYHGLDILMYIMIR